MIWKKMQCTEGPGRRYPVRLTFVPKERLVINGCKSRAPHAGYSLGHPRLQALKPDAVCKAVPPGLSVWVGGRECGRQPYAHPPMIVSAPDTTKLTLISSRRSPVCPKGLVRGPGRSTEAGRVGCGCLNAPPSPRIATLQHLPDAKHSREGGLQSKTPRP